MTELQNSYCKPKTEEEWELFGLKSIKGKPHVTYYNNGIMQYHIHSSLWMYISRTEIPVSKFHDLVEDRICGWRCVEAGAEDRDDDEVFAFVIDKNYGLFVMVIQDKVSLWLDWEEIRELNIKTFTELLTQLTFLGYDTTNE